MVKDDKKTEKLDKRAAALRENLKKRKPMAKKARKADAADKGNDS